MHSLYTWEFSRKNDVSYWLILSSKWFSHLEEPVKVTYFYTV